MSKQINVVGIILIEEDYQTTALMMQHGDTWEFPNGIQEDNETEIESVSRNVKEHTDLNVIGTPELFGVYNDKDQMYHAYLLEAEGTVSTSSIYTDKRFVNVYFNAECKTTKVNRYIFEDLKQN